MRKLLFILLLLFIIPVYANEPTPETACCMDFLNDYPLLDQCDQYEINKQRCEGIVSDYNTITSPYVGWAVIIPLFLLTAGLFFALWWIWRGHKKWQKMKVIVKDPICSKTSAINLIFAQEILCNTNCSKSHDENCY